MNNSWGFDPNNDLKKSHKGVIRGQDENGFQTDEVLVYFEFKHSIPAKEAALMLIGQLSWFLSECDEYGIV